MKAQTAKKLALKRILSRIPTPRWTKRYPDLGRLSKIKINALCQKLLNQSGGMVFGGPFAGMRLANDLSLSWDPKFIVGSYEEEIHHVINDVICAAPTQVIDIGAAFGYYAVGFAMKIANTTVDAFEAVEIPHWSELARLAKLNKVSDKIIQHGACSAAELAKVCTPNSFILSDCEGCEEDILDPHHVPALKLCTMLVELHEFHRPNLVGTLIERFRASHNIRIVEETARDIARYRVLKGLPLSWRYVAIEETKWIGEHPSRITTWLRFMVLEPKS